MPLIEVTDIDDPRLNPYLRLTDRQLRSFVDPSRAQMICESAYVIEVALDTGYIPQSLFINSQHLATVSNILDRVTAVDRQIPIYTAPPQVMSKITGFAVTRGIFGCFPRPEERTCADVLDGLGTPSRVAVLEGQVDVSNGGAIFRSAAALGADAVLLSPTCADPLNRRSLRVSMGTVLQVPWARLPKPWPAAAIDLLHRHGYTCSALALDQEAIPLDDPTLAADPRLALFFGTEGPGLSPAALAACDRTVIIPMRHGVDSLNVAAASAVAFWQLCARR